jgi:dihydrofolate synthase/folylpolyglutamate synthase
VNYPETLAYLFNTLPLFSRIGPAAYKKDLTNTIALCDALDHPEKKFPSIHVGGTNGKGSVSHMLAAVFNAAGYTTGLYTSPHVYDFRERIRVNGIGIEEDFVVGFVEKMRPLMESIHPSFFEITVAMAFDYFVEKKVDIAIIEVGLGGRLDSTNIIQPQLSVITNIGWDHMNMLGDTLNAIATEKAGIIKQDTPVVIGEKHPETEKIFRDTAAAQQAPITFAEEVFSVQDYKLHSNHIDISVRSKTGETKDYSLDLPGIYQTKNLLTVLAAIKQLPQWKLEQRTVLQALRRVKQTTGLHGRWETLRERPALVLEVAHNKEGVLQMLEHLRHLEYRQLHLIIGMVKDKDPDGVLSLLPTSANYYFTQAQIPRALEAAALQQEAQRFGLKGSSFGHVHEAVQAAWQLAEPEDLIVVSGSIFLVGEVDRNLVAQLS